MSAFAFDKPVIATNVGGLPEMLENGKYGMLVNNKDIKALASGITTLLNDNKLLDKYRENISKDYSIGEKSWDYIAQIIRGGYAGL